MGGNGSIIVSAVPAHVFLPDCVSRYCCLRSIFMDEVGIEPTSSIGDALAMRPLHPMPAGIGLPLAELILGIRDFALCGGATTVPYGNRTVSRGNCVVCKANRALPSGLPQAFEKA